MVEIGTIQDYNNMSDDEIRTKAIRAGYYEIKIGTELLAFVKHHGDGLFGEDLVSGVIIDKRDGMIYGSRA